MIALEPSIDSLEALRSSCDDSRVWYLVGSADVLPLPDASVDVVLGESLSLHVRNLREATRDLFRVLKPAGRVSLAEPPDHDEDDLVSTFVEVGFTALDVDRQQTALYVMAEKP
jgi:ubiquinone/menaquinone biosynthesis C-methylase UbiE